METQLPYASRLRSNRRVPFRLNTPPYMGVIAFSANRRGLITLNTTQKDFAT
jgi:hypothetical protein